MYTMLSTFVPGDSADSQGVYIWEKVEQWRLRLTGKTFKEK